MPAKSTTQNRGETDKQREVVKTLSKLCVAEAVIAKHITELHGKCLTVENIQNIRRQGQTIDELSAKLEVLEDICHGTDNKVVINAREDGEILGIFFQTAEQRELLRKSLRLSILMARTE